MSVTISVRVEDGVRREIEALGVTPGEFLRSALERELRRERSRRALAWLGEHRARHRGTSAEELVREDRDAR